MPVASCQFCRWTPVPHIPYWECVCGELFDAFGHKGHCPACQERVALVRCPKCAILKPYGWWLGEEKPESEGSIVAHIAESAASVFLQTQAAAWVDDRKQFLKEKPASLMHWQYLLSSGSESLTSIEYVIEQVAGGHGFNRYHPVTGIGINDVESALTLLNSGIIERSIPDKRVRVDGITNEYTIQTGGGMIGRFYHFNG